jgi:hypothetical protein
MFRFSIHTPSFTGMFRGMCPSVHVIAVRFFYKRSSQGRHSCAGPFRSPALRSTLPVSCDPSFRIALAPSKFRFGLDFQFTDFSSQTSVAPVTDIPPASARQWRPDWGQSRSAPFPETDLEAVPKPSSALFDNWQIEAMRGRQPAVEIPKRSEPMSLSPYSGIF